MGRRIVCAVLLAVAAVVGATGCREEREQMPAACLEGTEKIQAALATAPEPVTIDGTRLSECFVKTSDTGDLTEFGASVLDVITRLGIEAKKDPAGNAVVELGYLRGALEKGADAGIHDELLRRIDQELLIVNTKTPEFRRGETAGKDTG